MQGIYLPVGLETLRLYEQPGPGLWSHAVLRKEADPAKGTIQGDVRVIDANGRVVLEALGFTLQRIGQETTSTALADWIYEIQWQPKPRDQATPPKVDAAEQAAGWVIFSDGEVGPRMQSLLEAARRQLYRRLAGRDIRSAGRPPGIRSIPLGRKTSANCLPPCVAPTPRRAAAFSTCGERPSRRNTIRHRLRSKPRSSSGA